MLAELKECFMEAYDDNQDGRIEIREVSWNCECVQSVVSVYTADMQADFIVVNVVSGLWSDYTFILDDRFNDF